METSVYVVHCFLEVVGLWDGVLGLVGLWIRMVGVGVLMLMVGCINYDYLLRL